MLLENSPGARRDLSWATGPQSSGTCESPLRPLFLVETFSSGQMQQALERQKWLNSCCQRHFSTEKMEKTSEVHVTNNGRKAHLQASFWLFFLWRKQTFWCFKLNVKYFYLSLHDHLQRHSLCTINVISVMTSLKDRSPTLKAILTWNSTFTGRLGWPAWHWGAACRGFALTPAGRCVVAHCGTAQDTRPGSKETANKMALEMEDFMTSYTENVHIWKKK